ncbi:MAG TPA: molybdopterin converting factor subunit 1 [Gemmatimonadaceae bacterium]|jgi:molybdopterin converting factor subunit 1
MTITVLLFASYADAVGRSEIELDVETGTTVRHVIDRVRAMGDAKRLPAAPMVAVNEEYATRDHELREGDEVALIPPVAGG